METYEKLKKEFNQKTKQLQKKCKHTELTDWMEIWWAIGHGTGNYCRTCKICNKEIHWKGTESYCPKCKRIEPLYWLECPDCKVLMDKQHVEKNLITGKQKILKRWKDTVETYYKDNDYYKDEKAK